MFSFSKKNNSFLAPENITVCLLCFQGGEEGEQWPEMVLAVILIALFRIISRKIGENIECTYKSISF